jgi:hypothetical protein
MSWLSFASVTEAYCIGIGALLQLLIAPAMLFVITVAS